MKIKNSLQKKQNCLKPILVSICLLLSACGGDDMSDLDAYIAEVKARPRGNIDALPESKTVQPFLYVLDNSRDPFKPVEKPEDIMPELDTTGNGKGIQPDLTRRKEDLESYALDTLRMVGTVDKEGLWALVRSNDGTIHRVKVGNYMGLNYGKVLEISDTEIKLMEIVPDKKPKTWREQPASLALITEE